MAPLPRLLFLLLFIAAAAGQSPAPAPAADGCNGVLLNYNLVKRTKIRPFVADNSSQPYSFHAVASVVNNADVTLKSWTLQIGFAYREILVSVGGAGVLADSTADLPYNTSLGGGKATAFVGYPNTDLLTQIATAGDPAQYEADIDITGTLFAGPEPLVPLPSSISLSNPEYICPNSNSNSSTNTTTTCCTLNPAYNFSTSINDTLHFLPRSSGDLVISYDVVNAYPDNYVALVTIENDAKLGRLDNWHLNWTWKRGEFIYAMKGAYPVKQDVTRCLQQKPAQYYKGMDFSKVLNCMEQPEIVDLPPTVANDGTLGQIPHCCRNGTLLPRVMDPNQAASAFYMTVYKMPPDLNVTALYPPESFKIWGESELNPDYICGQPARVKPTEFPNPNGIQSSSSAIASWQVVCNITVKTQAPKCCVTFSAYYNQSVIPCKTCACGCSSDVTSSKKCSTGADSMLLPPEALLVPFDNRTAKALAWAGINHFQVPNPLPCGDFCGVSINWHVATDYANGWSARITLFNWENTDMANWFAAVVLDKAYDGYQQMYSFNASAIGNNTIFMQGNQGLNYLVKETNGTSSTPPNPGKQQSVISFTKGPTPGIDIVAGGGFPSKVYFNGEECQMPGRFLTSKGMRRTGIGGIIAMLLTIAVSAVLSFGV